MAPKTVANPTNSWQQEARESKPIPTSQDGQRSRVARDAYADKVIGAGIPIEELLEKHWSYNNPSPRLPTGNEGILPPVPDETVVLGTFDSLDVILTASRRAIYSEMHIGVDRAVYPQDSTAAGRVIDIIEPGGTVLLHDGKSISYKTAPRAYGLLQLTRYVLFLRHSEQGDFYLLYDSIAIANGLSRPNSPDAVNAAKAGRWLFSSMKEEDVVKILSV